MTTPTLAPDAQRAIDAYLEAIEHALTAAGQQRDQRRAVADDVDAQIRDMLAEQVRPRAADPAGPPVATLADVQVVLSQLDSPAAYAPPAPAAPLAPSPATDSPFRRALAAYLVQLIPVAFLVPAPTMLLLFFVPRFREVYRDFHAPLPTMTERALRLSGFVMEGGWLLAVPLVLLLPVPGALLGALIKNPRTRRSLLVLLVILELLLALAFATAIFIACWLPTS